MHCATLPNLRSTWRTINTRLSSSVHACYCRTTCHTSNNATEQSRPQAIHIVHWRAPTNRSKSPTEAPVIEQRPALAAPHIPIHARPHNSGN